MGTMNISLPDSLRRFIEDQVREEGYGNTSEYVRELVRRDQDRRRLREALLEGAASAPAVTADAAWFRKLRDRIAEDRGAG